MSNVDQLTHCSGEEQFIEAIDALLDAGLVEWVGTGPELTYRVTDLGFRGGSVLLALVSNLIELADPRAFSALEQVQAGMFKVRFRLFDAAGGPSRG